MPLSSNSALTAHARAEENRLKAFELYKAGATLTATGRALGVSHTTARNYVTSVLDRLAADSKALAERYRNLQMARLQDMVFALWPKVRAGDVPAVLALLRIMEREAKLLGLDAPTKVDIEARVRLIAEREGFDPDEAVRDVYRILKESREE